MAIIGFQLTLHSVGLRNNYYVPLETSSKEPKHGLTWRQPIAKRQPKPANRH